jgi:hypothetical protein
MRKVSFLMFMAAFMPLSKILPQLQARVRSGKGGPPFFAPLGERVLPDGSHPPIFISRFPCSSSLHSKNRADAQIPFYSELAPEANIIIYS